MTPAPASPSRPRPRAKLDAAVVVDAALEVADSEGLDAVTIRRLAQDLSVTPMALYWHFEDKDALLAAVARRLWDDTEADLAAAAGGGGVEGWDLLRATMDALVSVMGRHPAIAPLVPKEVFSCEAGLAVTERTLELLAGFGFDPAKASVVARFVLCSAVMLVGTQPGAEIADAGERAEAQRRKQLALASLPLGRYPHIAASAHHLTDCDTAQGYFEEGIDLVLAGVRHQAPAPAG